MSTHEKPRALDQDATVPPLKLLECVPPSVAEIVRAADSADEPRFLLRLSRPLTVDERRVVALELPNAILHDDDDPHLTVSVAPDYVIERPHALQTIVQGISSVTIRMRRAEVELLAECASAAIAVNELLRAATLEAPSTNGHGAVPAAGARPTHRARRRHLRA